MDASRYDNATRSILFNPFTALEIRSHKRVFSISSVDESLDRTIDLLTYVEDMSDMTHLSLNVHNRNRNILLSYLLYLDNDNKELFGVGEQLRLFLTTSPINLLQFSAMFWRERKRMFEEAKPINSVREALPFRENSRPKIDVM